MPPSAIRSVFVVLLALSAVAGLSGCGNEPPEPEPTEPRVTATETPTVEPTEPPAEEPVGTPVDIPCDVLVPQSAIDQLFSDFQPDPSYVPAPGSAADRAVQSQGVACGWLNSEGVLLEVSVAQLPAESLTEIGNDLVVRSNPVPTYGVEGYFQLNGEIGEAEAISPPYWIAVVSTHLFEPGDAAPVVEAAVTALG